MGGGVVVDDALPFSYYAPYVMPVQQTPYYVIPHRRHSVSSQPGFTYMPAEGYSAPFQQRPRVDRGRLPVRVFPAHAPKRQPFYFTSPLFPNNFAMPEEELVGSSRVPHLPQAVASATPTVAMPSVYQPVDSGEEQLRSGAINSAAMQGRGDSQPPLASDDVTTIPLPLLYSPGGFQVVNRPSSGPAYGKHPANLTTSAPHVPVVFSPAHTWAHSDLRQTEVPEVASMSNSRAAPTSKQAVSHFMPQPAAEGVQKAYAPWTEHHGFNVASEGNVAANAQAPAERSRIKIIPVLDAASSQTASEISVEKNTLKKKEVDGATVLKEGKKKVMDLETAAVKIQSTYRSYVVRRSEPLKHLRQIARLRPKLGELQMMTSDMESLEKRCMDQSERLKLTEGIMSLLLQLDIMQGVDPVVRDRRKTLTRELIKLQEVVDSTIERLSTSKPALPAGDELLQPTEVDNSVEGCTYIAEEAVTLEPLEVENSEDLVDCDQCAEGQNCDDVVASGPVNATSVPEKESSGGDEDIQMGPVDAEESQDFKATGMPTHSEGGLEACTVCQLIATQPEERICVDENEHTYVDEKQDAETVAVKPPLSIACVERPASHASEEEGDSNNNEGMKNEGLLAVLALPLDLPLEKEGEMKNNSCARQVHSDIDSHEVSDIEGQFTPVHQVESSPHEGREVENIASDLEEIHARDGSDEEVKIETVPALSLHLSVEKDEELEEKSCLQVDSDIAKKEASQGECTPGQGVRRSRGECAKSCAYPSICDGSSNNATHDQCQVLPESDVVVENRVFGTASTPDNPRMNSNSDIPALSVEGIWSSNVEEHKVETLNLEPVTLNAEGQDVLKHSSPEKIEHMEYSHGTTVISEPLSLSKSCFPQEGSCLNSSSFPIKEMCDSLRALEASSQKNETGLSLTQQLIEENKKLKTLLADVLRWSQWQGSATLGLHTMMERLENQVSEKKLKKPSKLPKKTVRRRR